LISDHFQYTIKSGPAGSTIVIPGEKAEFIASGCTIEAELMAVYLVDESQVARDLRARAGSCAAPFHRKWIPAFAGMTGGP